MCRVRRRERSGGTVALAATVCTVEYGPPPSGGGGLEVAIDIGAGG